MSEFDRINIKSAEINERPIAKKKPNIVKTVISVVVGTICGIVVIIGVFFLANYLATLNSVTYNEFCMSDLNCLKSSNMTCVSGKCACPNGTTWNNAVSYCWNVTVSNTTITNSTNTTNSTTATSRLSSIFTGSPYTTYTITTYNSTPILNALDVVAIYTTETFYLVTEWSNKQIIFFNQTGGFVRAISTEIHYVEYYNGYIYATTDLGYGWILKFDLYGNPLNQYYNGGATMFSIAYNAQTDYVYVTDTTNNMIRAFDKNLNYISSQSFTVSGPFGGIACYMGYVYVGTNGNQMLIYQGTTLKNTYSSMCKTGSTYDIYIHADTGYMLVSCNSDKKIYLWFTNGTQAFFTGLFLNTVGGVRCSAIDSFGRVVTTMQSPNRIDIYTL